jgi:thioredoxin-like negative regulator of GroEL
LPVVDAVSADYAGEVTFLAVAWKASLEDTAAAAAEVMPSGRVKWGLDADETVFAAFGVPYQPVTVMIGADKTIVDAWPGALSEDEIRAKLDALVSG